MVRVPVPTVSECASSLRTPADVRNRLWNSGGFFLLVWGVHYFPFFLMSRQLFIHHYLPSHLASSLIAGSVLSFVLSETINYPISIRGPSMRSKPRPATYSDLGIKGPVVVGVFSLFLIGMFMYMGPLTYGTPGLVLFLLSSSRLLF
jgi:dolichyl-phosphate-mannose-protein mannosyltransferase